MSAVSAPVKPILALKREVEIKLVFISFNSFYASYLMFTQRTFWQIKSVLNAQNK